MYVEDGTSSGICNNCVDLVPGPVCGECGIKGLDKYNKSRAHADTHLVDQRPI